MLKILSTPTVSQSFPGGTIDPGFSFVIVGALADGTPFASTVTSPDPSVQVDLLPGRYTGSVSKLGYTSLPSDEIVIDTPTTVTFSVPDPTTQATFGGQAAARSKR